MANWCVNPTAIDVMPAIFFLHNVGRYSLVCNELPDGTVISTVCLGRSRRQSHYRLPSLWETSIFGGPGNGTLKRYTSYADAVAGHQLMVIAAMNCKG